MTKYLNRVFLLLLGLLATATPPAVAQPAPQSAATTIVAAAAAPVVLPPYLRQDLYPKWIDAKAQVSWPPNDGYAAAPVAQTLAAGTMIDRFGSENGRFFSPKGESFKARAVPYVCSQMVYTI